MLHTTQQMDLQFPSHKICPNQTYAHTINEFQHQAVGHKDTPSNIKIQNLISDIPYSVQYSLFTKTDGLHNGRLPHGKKLGSFGIISSGAGAAVLLEDFSLRSHSVQSP